LAGQLVYDKATRKFLLGDPDERKRALDEHLRILAALEARDEDGAERAMRDHVVRSGRQHVAAAFARREE
jgi:DNA-binding GntR family transcriptional regulator